MNKVLWRMRNNSEKQKLNLILFCNDEGDTERIE